MKLGILGMGSIGARHAENARLLGHDVYSYDPAHGQKPAVRDKIIEHCDAIVIATPTELHYGDLLDAMKKSKPIFIEKPLFDTHQRIVPFQNSINDIIGTMKFYGQPISVGFMLRFHPYVIKAHEYISKGYIGKPRWASFTIAQKNDKPAYLRDGVINNFASHEIDVALHLLGPGEVMCASAHTTDGNDDLADFVIGHNNGAYSCIHCDYITDPERRGFLVVGDQGVIEADIARRKFKITGKVLAMREVGAPDWDAVYLAEMKGFVERIETGNGLIADWRDGVATMEIVLKIREMAGL